MEQQAIFDKVVRHLYKQGQPAMAHAKNSTTICAYRNSKGQTCAVGCLIPKNLYTPEIENCSVAGIGDKTHQLRDILRTVGVLADSDDSNSRTVELLGKLQFAHDNAPTMADTGRFILADLHRQLLNVAERFGLDTAELDKHAKTA